MLKIYKNKKIFQENVLPRYACGFPLDENNRERISLLDSKWRFKFYSKVSEAPDNFYEDSFDCSDFDLISVPSEWQIKGYDIPLYANITYPYAIDNNPITAPHIRDQYNSVGLYIREFDYDGKAERVVLHFGGINPSGEIYLNGDYVGYSEDTFDPQEYDVTDLIKPGINRLCVAVYRYCTGSYLEDQDMWRLSGIFRSVSLVRLTTFSVRDAYVSTCKLKNDYSSARFELVTETNATEKFDVTVTLTDKKGKVLFSQTEKASTKNVFVGDIDKIEPWSHEYPVLYRFTVTLTDNGKTIDKRSFAYGFKEVKIVGMDKEGRGPFILLNGRPLKFRGVNRHEFHPEYGHAVPEELIRKDLEICLKNNITAIRTSHYPNQPVFYDLCDEMGILVMAETNLETHGASYYLPKNSRYWEKQCVYRITNMIKTFRNHACIVSWSLGNEAGFGRVFVNMKKAALALDTSRFIHYEGDYTAKTSDVMSEMYTKQEEMSLIGKCKKTHVHGTSLAKPLGKRLLPKVYRDKPFVLCEYSHCMGNSLGNFADYWNDIKKYDRLAGGFIWDFADQSIKIERDGKTIWTYGGDFGDKPNFGSFCYNGILRADRTPNPALYEVNRQYQSVDFFLANNTLTVKNNFMFTDLKGYILKQTLLVDGLEKEIKKVALPSVPAGETGNLPIELPDKQTRDVSLLVEMILPKDKGVRKKGERIAYEQFILEKSELSCKELLATADYKEAELDILITAGNTKFVIDKVTGGITSISKNDTERLHAPILPLFTRPTTDNDSWKIAPKFSRLFIFRPDRDNRAQAKLMPKKIDIKNEDGIVVLTITWKFPKAKLLTTVYRFGEDGVDMQMTITPKKELVRYGFSFATREDVKEMRYFAKGPFENYCDRQTAAVLKEYAGVAEDFNHEYLYPQENGNHTEARILDLGKDGSGLAVLAVEKPFEFSVRPYSIEKLEKATHVHELVKDGYNTITIDGKQRGVGGDGTGIAYLKPQYKIHPRQNYNMAVRIVVK